MPPHAQGHGWPGGDSMFARASLQASELGRLSTCTHTRAREHARTAAAAGDSGSLCVACMLRACVRTRVRACVSVCVHGCGWMGGLLSPGFLAACVAAAAAAVCLCVCVYACVHVCLLVCIICMQPCVAVARVLRLWENGCARVAALKHRCAHVAALEKQPRMAAAQVLPGVHAQLRWFGCTHTLSHTTHTCARAHTLSRRE